MIALALAAGLGITPVTVRPLPQTSAMPRYMRIEMRVRGYGLQGTGEMLFDRRDGRFVQHLRLGPASQWIGFDGQQAWFADATGLAVNEGNADQRSAILVWSKLFTQKAPESIDGTAVRYAGLSRSLKITTDANGYVKRASIPKGGFSATLEPSDYREASGGFVAPFHIAYTDDNGTWSGDVTRIDTARSIDPSAFSRPARPDDANVTGITSVHFASGFTLIAIPARINGGPVMHFLLDTGGQNILTIQAARKLHVNVVGGGTVGGAGAALIASHFAHISSVRVGAAEMRNQPFMVLELPFLKGIDGVLGYELLARFAARIDYERDTLELSAHVPAAWAAGAKATSFVYNERQPQFHGSIDGISSNLTMDTGSSGVLDVNTPFASKHGLWKRYNAPKPKTAFAGVGGTVKASPIIVKTFLIGNSKLTNVPANLTMASGGVEVDPSVDANVGEGVFRQFTLVLDYRNQYLHFTTGGLHDRSGITIAARGNALVVESVHRGTQAEKAGILAGMRVTAINGTTVGAADLERARSVLNGPDFTQVSLMLDGKRHVRIRLANYL